MTGKLTMINKNEGWVIINMGHPSTGTKYIVNSSFSFTKRDAIKNFIEGSTKDWSYWKRKYNFRCERATQTIECHPKTL